MGLFGGNDQAKAAQAAADAQVKMNKENIAFAKELYADQKQQSIPWYNAGADAISQLQQAINSGSFNMNTSLINQQTYTPSAFTGDIDITQDPSYQFRLQQGVNALDMSAAAKGRLLSGAQDKAITEYGQNLASEEYGNAFNRALTTFNTNEGNNQTAVQLNNAANLNTWNALSGEMNNQYNRLAGVSGIGQNANNTIINAGQNMGNTVTQSNTNIGNALAQNAITQGQIKANNAATVGNVFGTALGYFL